MASINAILGKMSERPLTAPSPGQVEEGRSSRAEKRRSNPLLVSGRARRTMRLCTFNLFTPFHCAPQQNQNLHGAVKNGPRLTKALAERLSVLRDNAVARRDLELKVVDIKQVSM